MHGSLSYGPRLVATPTGGLLAAAVALPDQSIERAQPLPGEPNAIASRAAHEIEVLTNTLEYYGCDMACMRPASRDPMSSALADLAVVFENGAVLMRPFALGRRADTVWLEQEFEVLDVPIAGEIKAPALLNGTDVLLIGRTAIIGLSERSNEAGRAAFASIARAHGFDVAEVALDPRAPSLRSVAGAIDAETVVMAAEWLDITPFAEMRRLDTERGEELGAGVFNLGNRHVLADLRYLRTASMLRKSGVTVDAIDLYDFGRIGITPSMLVLDLKRS